MDVKWHGSTVVEVTYKDASGRPANELLYRDREPTLEIVTQGTPFSFDGDGAQFRLASEARRISLAYLFDPLLAVHTSIIEPLPHQITAVYGEMLPRQPLRFLLADDPGAGKTIMAGLLIKELMIRGDLHRCLICCPGNLAEQWQDELDSKFHLPFEIVGRDAIEASRTGNPYLEKNLVISRLDLMSRNEDVLAKLEQTEWDLVVADEAHKLHASFFGGEVRETKRYKLGKVLGRLTRHLLLMTATPHNGKEEDFQLFMALLDADRFEGRFRDGVHVANVGDLMRRCTKETLVYLADRLRTLLGRPEAVVIIHGGLGREERRKAQDSFTQDKETQILVATDVAGEGINLQRAHLMVNYDLPWNPNRLEQRFGRIHRIGQRKNCLIFNFVATNTIEGRVLQRLLEKLQEIRDALDDDAVFNVVGEVLPASHVERVLRDYYAGRLGDADLEERLLRNVDEREFRRICQNALEGLASKKLNLEMLIERRARAQERRVVPETIARFIRDAAEFVPLTLKAVPHLPHAFEPGRTPSVLRRYETDPTWKLPALAAKYPRCSTDRETAETHNLEWVTPGHPLFEAIRRHTHEKALEVFGKGATFYSLQHDVPARIDFYRARVVDGLGQVIHERLFPVEIAENGAPRLREPSVLGDFTPADPPETPPTVATLPDEEQLNHRTVPHSSCRRSHRSAGRGSPPPSSTRASRTEPRLAGTLRPTHPERSSKR
ncbi:MAG: DEAD/DEAH box helicase [Bryobacteraceae bacterium]|nr:DEAD/DEAH box helicase [Bryobacteraceae bacterium]